MLNQPISSPQMMRMFGFPVLAIPISSCWSCRLKPNAGSMHSGGGFVHHPQRVVEGEGVGLLNRREVLERRRPFGGGRLRSVQQVDVLNVPLPVGVGPLIPPPVRVRAKI